MDRARGGVRAAALLALALALPAAGGPRVEPRLRLTAESRYDDDALLLLEDGRGQLMSKLIPQVGLAVSGRTFGARGWYSPDLILRHGSGTFSVDHRGALSLRKAFSERAWARSGLRMWRVSDPTSLPRLGLARELVPVTYGRGDLSAHLRATDRWTLGAGYVVEGVLIEDGRSVPGWMHAPYADAWFRLDRRTDLGLEYRAQLFTLGREWTLAHTATAAARRRFSRQTYALARAGAGFWGRPGEWTWRPFPRVSLEVGRDGDRLDLALVAGHDLVGASGFTSALWADFASVTADWRVSAPFRLYAGASYYRNGRAPDWDWGAFATGRFAQGYALGAGAEWTLRRGLALQLAVDRYAQLGAPDGAPNLSRNVISMRVVATPFQGGPEADW